MKIKRVFKSNIFTKGITSFKRDLISGEYGYIILKNHLLNKKNLESGRVLIKRELKKKCKLYTRPRFLTPITKKASGIRMGKGKGPIFDHISFLKMDSCLYEIDKTSLPSALKILKKLSYKFGKPIALVDSKSNRYYIK
ncbi:MAG: rplP [Haloplasmataceae bacterium]|jgi:ribosomal protein L16/L10AE|nr:rplP [Haloplasmataceae bacterium]